MNIYKILVIIPLFHYISNECKSWKVLVNKLNSCIKFDVKQTYICQWYKTDCVIYLNTIKKPQLFKFIYLPHSSL